MLELLQLEYYNEDTWVTLLTTQICPIPPRLWASCLGKATTLSLQTGTTCSESWLVRGRVGETADLHRESVFIVVSVAVHVVADQLLAVLILDGNHRLEELNQSLPLQWKQTVRVETPGHQRLLSSHLAFRGEEEVEPLMMRLDADTVLRGVVFDEQLLQEEQSLPLLGFLSHLNQAVPVILGLSPVTVRTHLISHSELHHEGLLEDGPAHHLCLHLQLHLQPLAVGLRPQEVGVDQLDFVETLQSLQTKSHQLPALQGCLDPLLRRLEISLTETAELNGHLHRVEVQQRTL